MLLLYLNEIKYNKPGAYYRMGRLERQYWAAQVAGLGVPRRDRAGGMYEAYVPDRLVGTRCVLDADVAADVADATSAITRLDVGATALTNTEALARLLLRAESVASSHIEGLRVSPQRLLRADIARAEGVQINDGTATEVLANVDAMAFAVRDVSRPVTLDRIIEVHRRLLAHTDKPQYAGVLRTEQNWIGGSDFNPLQAAFVPPPWQAVHDFTRGSRRVLQRRRTAGNRASSDRACAIRNDPPIF